MDCSIEGKSVLITGASSGIGEATARRLVADGANVVLFARRADRIADLADELGRSAIAISGDVTQHADLVKCEEAARNQFGSIDILVNNAGIMPLSKLAERRVADWKRMIDVNIMGILNAIDVVLPGMLARGSGHVVNISSLAGWKSMPTTAVYSATKFAVRAISDGLRLETEGRIRVSAIYPGPVSTELADSIPDPALRAGLDAMLTNNAMPPAEIASAISYIVSRPENVGVNDMIISPPGIA